MASRSTKKRAGSVTLSEDASAPPPLRIETSPQALSNVPLIPNKSGLPSSEVFTSYRPNYTPTNEYFVGKFAAENRVAPDWVWWWMLIASIVVAIDSLYVLGIYYKATEFIPSAIKSTWAMYGETDKQYAADGKGITASNGWMPTQSQFNVLEILGQLVFLRLHMARSSAALSVAMMVSVATLWKTLIYMAIIANANDPYLLMPSLKCFKPGAFSAPGSTCIADAVKFSFNFWWIIVPFFVIVTCHNRIVASLSK